MFYMKTKLSLTNQLERPLSFYKLHFFSEKNKIDFSNICIIILKSDLLLTLLIFELRSCIVQQYYGSIMIWMQQWDASSFSNTITTTILYMFHSLIILITIIMMFLQNQKNYHTSECCCCIMLFLNYYNNLIIFIEYKFSQNEYAQQKQS